jgi:NADP-dependent alcohol dehydrogenase
MDNFTFQNPTKILFGRGQIAGIANEIPKNAKVLMTYGGGSIKKNGVYEQVVDALKDHTVIEFHGIEPNPHYETLMRAVEICKKENIDYCLAVGGGSVIDGTKFIAAGATFEGDPWDFIEKRTAVTNPLPIGAVLTLAATGSEMNGNSVINHKAKGVKLGFRSALLYPQFSVLDPETTFSLPLKQVSNGIVDAFTHVMEQYLTYPADGHLQDRFAESILQTLIEVGPVTLENPRDYEARASFVWSATLALNGLIGCGVPSDWATHMIGYSLTVEHGLDHAQTLAILLPTIMDYKRETKREKLLQYAERVWNITEGDENKRIDAAIQKTRAFFESVNVKTRLSDYNIDASHIDKLVEIFDAGNLAPAGEHKDIHLEDAHKIFTESL